MFDPKRFKEALEVDFAAANKSAGELESMVFRHLSYTDVDYEIEEQRLEHHLDRLYLKLAFALELAGATQALQELRRCWKKQAQTGLAHMQINPTADFAYSTGLDVLESVSDALFAATGVGDVVRARHDLLIQILEQTAAIIEFQSLPPQRRQRFGAQCILTFGSCFRTSLARFR